VVATKADRVGNKLSASLKALKQEFGTEDILPYSAKTGAGQNELWQRIKLAGEAHFGEAQEDAG
jgi:selenocysteine-specific translation elongation factor